MILPKEPTEVVEALSDVILDKQNQKAPVKTGAFCYFEFIHVIQHKSALTKFGGILGAFIMLSILSCPHFSKFIIINQERI